ncbi:MAG: 1,4-dihydroxy-2-naphthoate polyprenyltransferase [Deltaproteobacteria bacterium]|nr:MAG: 1,4-dihydroxy-2-naphthoate polyprenyltransferase [Deltaproteobacteria bacterium]
MCKQLSKVQLWLLAARPKTLPAAAGPVLVGTAVAARDGHFLLIPALATFLGALLLQIAVNFANDYFDAKNAIDSEERLGPVRVTQSGLIPPAQVRLAMSIALVAAALVFVYLTIIGGKVIFWVGVCSILSALAYSGGPYPLASHGLGELFVLLFFGPVAVCCTAYLQAGSFTLFSLQASLVPGLLITAIMVINNLRDIPTDRKAGKKTLAVRLGRSRTLVFYRILLISAYLVPVGTAVFGQGSGLELLVFVTLPLAVSLYKEVETCTGSLLNGTLARTARLSFFASLFFSLGLMC